MGLFGGGGNIARRAGEDAAKAIRFDPLDVGIEGLGDVTFGMKQDKRGQVLGEVGFQLTPEQQAQVAALQAGAVPAITGAGALSPGVLGAGQAGLSQAQQALSALGAFDPMAAAEERFGRLDEILQRRRDVDRSALESRLLAQGRLESTAGARQMGEFEAGIERERSQLLDRQFTEAQAAQANLANIAASLTGQGVGTQQALQAQGLFGIQGPAAVADPLFRQAALGADLGNLALQGQIAKAGAISGHNQTAAASGGGGLMSGLLTGAAGAFGSAFGGPAGGYLATKAAGLFGGGTSGGGTPYTNPSALGMGNYFMKG